MKKHVLFVFTYIQPQHSPYYAFSQEDNGILTLEKDLMNLQLSIPIDYLVICGDLNAITGSIQPAELLDSETRFVSGYVTDGSSDKFLRDSQDKTTNNFGRSLINLCSCLDLIILNGLDSNSQKYTNISCHGSSVIDYFIMFFNLVRNCKMLVDDNFLSSHFPIILYIDVEDRIIDNNISIARNKLFWNDTNYV